MDNDDFDVELDRDDTVRIVRILHARPDLTSATEVVHLALVELEKQQVH